MTKLFITFAVVIAGLAATKPITADPGAWLFVSLLSERKIVTFERDRELGTLSRRGTTNCTAEPACQAVSPDGKTLFVSFRSSGQLASFKIDQNRGSLSLISVVEGGADPAYLLPDRTGRYLLSAYYQADKVTVHNISPDGTLKEPALQTIPTADNAHGIVLDSTNRFAFVPHTGANRIYQFKFTPETGRLSSNDPPFVTTPTVDHPRHIALHPSNQWAYVSNEAGDSIGVFQVDLASGTMVKIQNLSTIPEDFDGNRNSTARCEISPNGQFVYVANRGHDSIACFEINQETGRVNLLEITPTEQTPRSFTIEPSGKFLYAAGQASGNIAAFRIRESGVLDRFATYESGPVSWWVQAVDVNSD